jgi:hypothetical protein
MTSSGTITATGPYSFTGKTHSHGGVIKMPNGKEVALSDMDIVTGKNDAIGEPVMGVKARAERMGNGVDRSEPFLEGRRAHRGGREHVSSGLQIAAVGDRARQVRIHNSQSLERDSVGERMKSVDGISLEAMRERVHPCRHGQEGGSPTASSGSSIAILGIISGWKMIFFS